MPLQRTTFNGLVTDPSPDQIGDSALRLQNVVPASARTVRPRDGVSMVKHDQPGVLGTSIIADGAPETDGEAILLTAIYGEIAPVQAATPLDELLETQIGQFFYRPAEVSDAYAATDGIAASSEIYALIF